MNIRIKLIIEYQKSQSDFIFENIVKEFNALIKFHLKTIPHKDKENIRQEILMALHDIMINRFKVNENLKINSELFSLENLEKLEKHNYTNVNKIFHNIYIKKFLNDYGKELFVEAFYDLSKKKQFLYEFRLYSNEKQFTYYINRTLKNIVNDYFRDKFSNKDFQGKSLNELSADGIELIDIIPDESLENTTIDLKKYQMDDEDLKFVLSFIDKGRILSEKEVALKYHISQQLVSKKLIDIKRKYEKNKI